MKKVLKVVGAVVAVVAIGMFIAIQTATVVRQAQAPASAWAGQPKAVPAEPDGTVARQPAAAPGGEARLREAAAVPGAAGAVPRRAGQAVGPGAEGAPRQAARREEARDAAVPRRVGPDAPAARPSVPAWAALPWIRYQEGRLAPLPRADSRQPREGLRIAPPSTRWWQAARGEALS